MRGFSIFVRLLLGRRVRSACGIRKLYAVFVGIYLPCLLTCFHEHLLFAQTPLVRDEKQGVAIQFKNCFLLHFCC